MHRRFTRGAAFVALSFALSLFPACSGGGGGSDSPAPQQTSTPTPTPLPTPTPSPTPTPVGEDLIDTQSDAARILTQGAFGPTPADIVALEGASYSDWFRDQLGQSPTYHIETVLSQIAAAEAIGEDVYNLPSNQFWRAAVEEDDQLRQRMAFALSQILVVSDDSDLVFANETLTDYMDILAEHAFGNYRDLLEAVTYSPAMANFLTYLNNAKADPDTGRMPDENYAREIMQLFTIGLIELEMDGSPRLDGEGQPIETYTNEDVRGLAKVFTGLSFKGSNFWDWWENRDDDATYNRLEMFDEWHSEEAKTFLGVTIPAGTSGDESIAIALDTLITHDNTPPFVARQLIQRFTTSHPSPEYIERVATAFAQGRYTLLDGSIVGDGRRGDLSATLAAILMDIEVVDPDLADPSWGRIREPVLRFLHWARAMNVNSGDASELGVLQYSQFPDFLGQHPYRSPSVFNFYRPGYVAPGTATGAEGLTAPELQIVNASTVIGYASFMDWFQRGWAQYDENGEPNTGFIPDPSAEVALADDPEALMERLDLLFTGGRLHAETRERIIGVLNEMPIAPYDPANEEEDRRNRVNVAVNMLLTSPEFLVQQ